MEIKCNKCGKTVSVDDNYNYKRCPNCKIKDEAYLIKKRELQKWDKQAKQEIKGLGLKEKLSPIFKNYSTYAKNYKHLFKRTPTFEEYEEALRSEKISQAYAQADRIKQQQRKEEN